MYVIDVLQAVINVVMCVFHIFYKVNFDFLTENSSKLSKHVVTTFCFRISYVLVLWHCLSFWTDEEYIFL